ncbi:hypothetical protein [Mycobacteroides abscessus]|uniref:hypothetical protein n=1 Tax=Mycobacteroides abscessus TaxID=36809 RepID=UPI0009CFE024|nr:hypothetical protein [Mycobacteroides abscessus]SKT78996.1 Uncharacterised protein [Mycobacteroides abscessus subsp. massiliense]SKU02869.1 Uncharacterised protein [Mycobacteroides abscessus subsp. massiliense]
MSILDDRDTRTAALREAVWLDDQPDSVGEWVRVMEDVASLATEVRDTRSRDPLEGKQTDLYLLDLDAGDSNRAGAGGLVLARRLVSRGGMIGIILVSRFFRSDRYKEIERYISPTIPVAKIEKNDIAIIWNDKYNTDRKGEESPHEVNRARMRIQDVVKDVVGIMEKEKRPPAPDVEALRAIKVPPMEEYISRSRSEKSALVLAARRALDSYLSELFDTKSNVAWITVGVPTGEVLKWGEEGDAPPRVKAEVLTLAREALDECVPITFHRPRWRDTFHSADTKR